MGTMAQTLEFSRKLALADIPSGGRDVWPEATPAECAALAGRLGLPALHGLRARLRVTALDDGAVVEGRFEADLCQVCVVSLEPFDVHLAGEVRQRYVTDVATTAQSGPLTDPWGEEAPEQLQDGVMDLGDLIVQYLAVAIDPYPRGPGADSEPPPQASPTRDGPFAALAVLKRGKT